MFKIVPELLGKNEVNEILQELELDIGPSKYGELPPDFANMEPDIFQERRNTTFSIENWRTAEAKELYDQLVCAKSSSEINGDIFQTNYNREVDLFFDNNQLPPMQNALFTSSYSPDHEQMDFTPFC